MATNPTPEPEITQDATSPRQQFVVNIRNPEANPFIFRFLRSPLKRKIVRAGRRGGKTVACAILAVEAFLRGKRVLYAAPTDNQLETFWNEVKLALDEPLRFKKLYKHEGRHIIQGTAINENEIDDGKKRQPRIRAKTAFNAETLRGDWCELLILDEFQSMDETAWTEVGSPMLIDNNGDVVFIYTPPSLESRSNSRVKDPQYAAKLFKLHKDDPLWLCIHFPSSANPFLSREGLEEVSRNMSTTAYRQEILAEDTEEIPGALWTRKIIEDSRIAATYRDGVLTTRDKQTILLRRIVVAIDPSGGNTTEVGIMVAGEGENEHVYVLRDASMKAARPRDWAEVSISLYAEFLADRIIGEKNYGGAMVEETLRNVDESVSYKGVDASRGKLVRAEPIVALFQRNRMHLVCGCGKPANQCTEFYELEEELVTYTAQQGQKSPNRLDSMVWAGIELSGAGSLGLLDLFKSGRVKELMGRRPVAMTPVPSRRDQTVGVNSSAPANFKLPEATPSFGRIDKVAAATSLAGVMTGDNTPHCPNCKEVTLQNPLAGQIRCGHCGNMYWPDGKVPDFQRPLGGRRIMLEK